MSPGAVSLVSTNALCSHRALSGSPSPVLPTLARCPLALGSPRRLITVIMGILRLAFWSSPQFPSGLPFIKLHVPHIPPMQLSTTS